MTMYCTLEAAHNLPMDEITRNAFEWPGWVLRDDPETLTEHDKTMIDRCLVLLSSDPAQRTPQNAMLVAIYALECWFLDEEGIKHPNFDSSLMDQVHGSQELAAFAIWCIVACRTLQRNDGVKFEKLDAAVPIVYAEAIAQRQAEEVRAGKRSAAKAGRAKNPAHRVMQDVVRAEFGRWRDGHIRYRNDADFARKMHAVHGDTIGNEGSIKNAVSRWRKTGKKSSS